MKCRNRHCSMAIPDGSPYCAYCGAAQQVPKRLSWQVYAAGFGALLILLLIAIPRSPEPEPELYVERATVVVTATERAPVSSTEPGSVSPGSSRVKDSFDTPNLNPTWYWVREDPTHWRLTAEPGCLQIVSEAGQIWERNGYDVENIVLQHLSVSPSSFDITTLLAFAPTVDWQSAGLIVYMDDDNYVTLYYGYHSDFGGKSVRFQSEVGASASETGVALDAPVIYLKVTKTDNSYSGYYSLDNAAWSKVGHYTNGMTNLSVGLIANNGTAVHQEAEANFDYFCLLKQ